MANNPGLEFEPGNLADSRAVASKKMKQIVLTAGLGLVTALGLAQSNQPAEPVSNSVVIAVVCGRDITLQDKSQLNGLIFETLLDKFAKDNKITPTEAELDAFARKQEEQRNEHQRELEQDLPELRKELQSTTLNARDRKDKEELLRLTERALKSYREIQSLSKSQEDELRPMKRRMAEQFVLRWKINQALYRKYGGRVIFQQAGMEPLDAYRDFLRDQERTGAFIIVDKQSPVQFWRYFTTDSMHTFLSPEEAAKSMQTPWWLLEPPPEPTAIQPAASPFQSKAIPQEFWIFECRGNEIYFMDKDELDKQFKKMLADESASGQPPTSSVGNANYSIAPESGIGMLRLHPRPGVHGDTVADLAHASGHYPTLLKQLAHTRPILFIDHGDSTEILKRAKQLAVIAGFATTISPLPQDQPIMFAK